VQPEDPARLGEYNLLEKLGQGGMAVVYRGERVGEAGFKKKVALKRMLPQFRRNPALLERFAAEARTNARLDHPNLVQVIDFGIDPEPFLVLEFVEGVPLSSLMQRLVDKREKLEIAAALFIGAEAAQGLDHAHRKRDEQGNPLGIVHRDVSPQNVLLSNEGAVKVSDFGLVKAADNVVQTGSGIPIGKMSYMAPEQAGHHGVDARADVFSLGVVVWEMLTMRTLLPSNDLQRASELLKTCNFKPPSAVSPNVPKALDDIVMRCLTRDPDQRTPSAQAVSMQLREALHELAPGYGRDQLARLVSWAFPERGWVIDEPHETAAQPTERQSMTPLASEAMQRISRGSQVPAAEPVKTMADARGAERGGGAAMGWLLLVVGAGLLALIALVLGAGLLFFMFAASDAQDAVQAPIVQPSSQPMPSTAPSIEIRTNVPNAQIFIGSQRLGPAPQRVSSAALGGNPIIAIAPQHQPVIVDAPRIDRLIGAGQPYEELNLVPVRRPDRIVFVRSPPNATVSVTHPPGQPSCRTPCVVRVPDTEGPRVVSPIQIAPDRGPPRFVSTAACDPLAVCVIE
jgi:serine/threonine protein kinase